MAETFYSVLGVESDADTESVQQAYRELVKEHHPDVSDDPAAPERFKRLTTARDVLVDDDERDRYDRLGHDKYVRTHVDSGGWASERQQNTTSTSASPRQSGTGSTTTTSGTSAASSRTNRGYDRTAWLGEDGPRGPGTDSRHRGQGRSAGHAHGGEEWQYASDTYRRAKTAPPDPAGSPFSDAVSGLKSVGPWLVIHVVFILSAIATALVTVSGTPSNAQVSLTTLVVGALVVGLVLFVSVMHVISQMYS